MSLGAWVVIIVIFFVIGNVMGLKPKISEVRVGDMRLFARKIELSPKLIATPDWIACDKGIGKNGMIAQYTLLDDDWRLPAKRYSWVDGVWQDTTGQPIHLPVPPSFCVPFLKAIAMKANSIAVYWHDEPYAKHFAVRDEQAMPNIEQDLLALKQFLMQVAGQT